jgi:hypothetical protein
MLLQLSAVNRSLSAASACSIPVSILPSADARCAGTGVLSFVRAEPRHSLLRFVTTQSTWLIPWPDLVMGQLANESWEAQKNVDEMQRMPRVQSPDLPDQSIAGSTAGERPGEVLIIILMCGDGTLAYRVLATTATSDTPSPGGE